MYKMKLQGDPNSIINRYRTRFNEKPFLYRAKVHARVRLQIWRINIKEIVNIINDGKNG